jgi:predicted RNA-binding protein associated with RNAse of E/G family
VVIEPDGTLQLKDEDDLEAAVAAGLFTPVQAEQIYQNAKLAGESFANGDWPFAKEWKSWRPDPSWPLPELPADAR